MYNTVKQVLFIALSRNREGLKVAAIIPILHNSRVIAS